MAARRRIVDAMATMLPQDVRVVAVVGCSKNAGKTTTLNALVTGLGDAGLRPGVLSIGIDGEEADFWLGVPKPRVEVQAGALVATAEAALAAGSAVLEDCEPTGGRTLLGDLVVGRVATAGSVLLAGIRAKDDIRAAIAILVRRGADRVLVDGAYQRLAAADPDISDGTIVATGAVLGPSVDEVARQTRDFLLRLRVPATDHPSDLALMDVARAANRLALRGPDPADEPVVADGPASPEAARVLAAGGAVLAVPGAVGDDLVRQCESRSPSRLRLVAQDPTRLFLSPREAARFQRRHDLRVARAIRVLAITVNPFSVFGWTLPRPELVDAIRAVAGGIDVLSFDIHPPPA